jgi:hypothetical protein
VVRLTRKRAVLAEPGGMRAAPYSGIGSEHVGSLGFV